MYFISLFNLNRSFLGLWDSCDIRFILLDNNWFDNYVHLDSWTVIYLLHTRTPILLDFYRECFPLPTFEASFSCCTALRTTCIGQELKTNTPIHVIRSLVHWWQIKHICSLWLFFFVLFCWNALVLLPDTKLLLL